MKVGLSIFGILCIFFFIGCTSVKDEDYIPSIASLKTNETLVMNVLECHRGCRTNTVKFENGEVTLIPYELELSEKEILELENIFAGEVNFSNDNIVIGRKVKLRPKEISDLDKHFSLEYSYCSNVIKVSFQHKRGNKVLNSKMLELYPCAGQSHDELTISRLIHYLTDERHEVPFWRLSRDEALAVIKSF